MTANENRFWSHLHRYKNDVENENAAKNQPLTKAIMLQNSAHDGLMIKFFDLVNKSSSLITCDNIKGIQTLPVVRILRQVGEFLSKFSP